MHFAEYASGGISTYLMDLIEAQCKIKYVDHVYLIVSKYKTDKELLGLRNSKLTIYTYEYRRSFKGLFKIIGMSRNIKKIDPDILHLHSSFAGVVRINFIFSKFKNRVVYCAHGWAFNRDINFLKKMMYMFLEKILSYGCKSIINISNSEAESAKFIQKGKMVTIYNSIP